MFCKSSSTKTKVESERNGIDLTNDLTIAYERGQYAQTDVFYDTRPDWIKNTDWADFTKTVGTSTVVATTLVGGAYLAGPALLSFGGATAESLTSGATVLGNIGRAVPAVASVVAAIKEAIDDFMNDGD